jgi:sec-independent protein translocase protein TatC
MWLLKKLFKKRDEQTGDGDIVKPFLDHLEDLRWTLVKMISTLTVTMLVAFGFRKQLAATLAYPLTMALGRGSELTLIATNPIDPVTMSFTLSFYAGIVVSFPVLFYFLAEFLLPALTKKEKRYVLPAVGIGFGLFLMGVLLCFFFVLPVTLRWLHSDAAGFGVKPSWTMKDYYGFVTHLCIAIGLVCELPVVMVTLSGIGLISYAWLKGMRMYGYAIALVLAAIISPTPDLFMLFLFALPIMLLFEICIWLVWLLEKRRAKHEEIVEKPHEQPYVPPPEDTYHDEHQGYDEHGHYHDEHGHYHDEHHAPDEPGTDKPAISPDKPEPTPEKPNEPDKPHSGPDKPAPTPEKPDEPDKPHNSPDKPETPVP